MQVQFYLTRVRGFAIGVVVYKPSYEFDDVTEDDEFTEIDIILGFISIKMVC
jgi:hypothetical protein